MPKTKNLLSWWEEKKNLQDGSWFYTLYRSHSQTLFWPNVDIYSPIKNWGKIKNYKKLIENQVQSSVLSWIFIVKQLTSCGYSKVFIKRFTSKVSNAFFLLFLLFPLSFSLFSSPLSSLFSSFTPSLPSSPLSLPLSLSFPSSLLSLSHFFDRHYLLWCTIGSLNADS